ncbi:MAG TPA: hypothetical protein VMT90_05605 [Dehalococcoidia bacterium]|jgi:hypothetical protein|nr:hypothetical protein [Dehalococcoidia bacterium]
MLAFLPHGSAGVRVDELMASARTRYELEALAVRRYEQTVLAYRVYIQLPPPPEQVADVRDLSIQPRRSIR